MKKKKTLENRRKRREERKERVIQGITWIFAGVCGLLFILIGMGLCYNLLIG